MNEKIDKIMSMARAYWEARILLTAVELDIFTQLANGPADAPGLAGKLSTDPRATEMLLNALVAVGVLVKNAGAYGVAPGLESPLSRGTPDSVLPMIEHMAHGWDRWGQLTETVRRGRLEKAFAPIESGAPVLEAFIEAMHAVGQGMASRVVGQLDLGSAEKMLDVGGGSGVYTIAALKAAPHLSAEIFDVPPVIAIARKKVAAEQLTGRVTFVAGDYHRDPLPQGHDLALLSAIIHANSPDENVALYKKIFNALISGGRIAIRDYVMDEDHIRPPAGALFAINMLINTGGGGTYAFGQIKGNLENVGFDTVTLSENGGMDSLVIARKP